jgi:hypothetical protein
MGKVGTDKMQPDPEIILELLDTESNAGFIVGGGGSIP